LDWPIFPGWRYLHADRRCTGEIQASVNRSPDQGPRKVYGLLRSTQPAQPKKGNGLAEIHRARRSGTTARSSPSTCASPPGRGKKLTIVTGVMTIQIKSFPNRTTGSWGVHGATFTRSVPHFAIARLCAGTFHLADRFDNDSARPAEETARPHPSRRKSTAIGRYSRENPKVVGRSWRRWNGDPIGRTGADDRPRLRNLNLRR